MVPEHVVRCRGQHECEWRVFDRGSDLVAYHSRQDYRRAPLPVEPPSRSKPPPWAKERGERYVVAVDDGWIVALNAGEFGAGIWWVARDGARYTQLSHENAVELIKTAAGVWAPTGLDHLVAGHGNVLLVARTRAKPWRVVRSIPIGASAYAGATTPDGSLIVVTRTGLVKVAPNRKATRLHTGRWDGFFELGPHASSAFYPGSVIVRRSGEVFIGMRAVVVRLAPQRGGYREDWLVPATCR